MDGERSREDRIEAVCGVENEDGVRDGDAKCEDGVRTCEMPVSAMPDWRAAWCTQCYRSSAAPSRTPATAIVSATPPIPIPTPSGCAALLVIEGGGEELAGAVVEAAVLEADPDTEDAEAEAEVDDGVNDRKERDVGFVASAQECSTSVSAEDTSAGHAGNLVTKAAA
ncbi:hypothetical protein FB451DRAFT_370884 [Mycena latifolia]|nr:hypothetical protein FB451DRAFT_370884 [Mycena latifolia]